MTPMAFAPRSGGGLPDTLPEPQLHPAIPHATWRQAQQLARDYRSRLQATEGFSERFAPRVAALGGHLEVADQ